MSRNSLRALAPATAMALGFTALPPVAQAATPTLMNALATPESQTQLNDDTLPGIVGDWPKFGSEATVNLEYDHLSAKGQPNGGALNIQANQQLLLEFDNHWSISTLLTLQPLDRIEAGRNRVLGHEALFAEELFARWNNQKLNIRAGKFDQNFARAWYRAPGLYAQDFVSDYAIGETLGIDAQVQLGSVKHGLHTISVSSFMADRTPLSDSLITRRGPLHYADGGVANTRGPTNFVVSYDATYVPIYRNWALDYQLSLARLAHGVDGDAAEQRYAASADINVPLGGGSVEKTLRGHFDELRFFGEAVRIDNQGGFAGHRADYQTISSELAHGQWVFDVSGTLRHTRVDGQPTWHDNLQSVAVGYNLPSDTVIAIGAAREHAQGTTGFTIGLSIAQVFTTCDRCLIRARHY